MALDDFSSLFPALAAQSMKWVVWRQVRGQGAISGLYYKRPTPTDATTPEDVRFRAWWVPLEYEADKKRSGTALKPKFTVRVSMTLYPFASDIEVEDAFTLEETSVEYRVLSRRDTSAFTNTIRFEVQEVD